MAVAATVTVITAATGLLVWAPWKPPAPPTGLAVTATTPTTVTLNWMPASRGTHISRYVILRDSVDIGSVSGARTAFVDTGLVPGGSYGYRVVAMDGSKRSKPSPSTATTVTSAPSPSGVQKVAATPESVTMTWTAPAGSPTPDSYLVLVDGDRVDTIGAGASSGTPTYRVRNLRFGTPYSLQVEARWQEGGTSPPSPALQVTTPNPPLSQARLEAPVSRVTFKVTASNSTDLPVGKTFTNTWSFTPECSTGACNVRLAGNFLDSRNAAVFEVVLTRRGVTYSGQTTASIGRCAGTSLKEKVKVTLTVKAAAGPDWSVTHWIGVIESQSPYTKAGAYYCPAGTTRALLNSAAPSGV